MNARPIIKICGIKTISDVNACLQCAVTAVGLNFFPPSPRSVSTRHARDLRARLGNQIQAIGVFVRPTNEEVERTVGQVGLDALQIHGADDAYLQTLLPLPVPMWLVQGIASCQDVERLKHHTHICQTRKLDVSAILADAKAKEKHGGTGQPLPWQLLKDLTWDLPLILSGGLNPENVAEAIRLVKPSGVDVASGVECAPGVKDSAKIEAFMNAAKFAFQQHAI